MQGFTIVNPSRDILESIIVDAVRSPLRETIVDSYLVMETEEKEASKNQEKTCWSVYEN